MNTIRLALGFALLAFSISVGAAPTVYRIAEFPRAIDGLYLQAPEGINDNNQVVGSTLTCRQSDDCTYDAYIWDVSKGLRVKLPRLAYTTFKGQPCAAHAINNKGRVVGHCGAEGGRPGIAVFWKDGVARALARFPDQTKGFAQAINESGQIAGRYTGAGSVAVRWIPGDASELGLPRGAFKRSYALDINDQGKIVGYFEDTSGEPNLARTYVFKPATGVYTFLPARTSGFSTRSAFAINSVGRIVGEDAGRAVAWNKSTLALKVLPIPSGNGICCSAAFDINDRDEVLGWGDPADGSDRDLYLVKGTSEVYRLKDLLSPEDPVSGCVKFNPINSSLTRSAVINNDGVIAASGVNLCTGVGNIYILTPEAN